MWYVKCRQRQALLDLMHAAELLYSSATRGGGAREHLPAPPPPPKKIVSCLQDCYNVAQFHGVSLKFCPIY